MSDEGPERRRHRRTTQAAARPLGARRLELARSGDLAAAVETAIAAADWLDESDAVGVAILGAVARRLAPATDGQLGLDGKPLPAKPIPHGEWIQLVDRAVDLIGALGLTARGRHGLGLHLVAADAEREPGSRAAAAAVTPRPRRRRLAIDDA